MQILNRCPKNGKAEKRKNNAKMPENNELKEGVCIKAKASPFTASV